MGDSWMASVAGEGRGQRRVLCAVDRWVQVPAEGVKRPSGCSLRAGTVPLRESRWLWRDWCLNAPWPCAEHVCWASSP